MFSKYFFNGRHFGTMEANLRRGTWVQQFVKIDSSIRLLPRSHSHTQTNLFFVAPKYLCKFWLFLCYYYRVWDMFCLISIKPPVGVTSRVELAARYTRYLCNNAIRTSAVSRGPLTFAETHTSFPYDNSVPISRYHQSQQWAYTPESRTNLITSIYISSIYIYTLHHNILNITFTKLDWKLTYLFRFWLRSFLSALTVVIGSAKHYHSWVLIYFETEVSC